MLVLKSRLSSAHQRYAYYLTFKIILSKNLGIVVSIYLRIDLCIVGESSMEPSVKRVAARKHLFRSRSMIVSGY